MHPESTEHLHRTLNLIRDGARRTRIQPFYAVEVLNEVADRVDLVLIMSVNPGFGGQAFIDSSLDNCAGFAPG